MQSFSAKAMRNPDAFFSCLKQEIAGELHYDATWRIMYATDASVYREIPQAVCLPAHAEDVKKVLHYANRYQIPVTARTAGTSLAGQVVAGGIIVDFSKFMNRILEVNPSEKWVRVEPGVVPDDLNRFLKPYCLYFGPETSTSNRCMVGGMVANNSCGANSLIYGSTRDHTLSITAILSDGSEAEFCQITKEEFERKCQTNNLEGKIYRQIFNLLSDSENQSEIRLQYPLRQIKRRNTGYALDLLLETELFETGGKPFNMCQIISGSEGTLALFKEIKLNLVSPPPAAKLLLCVHLNNVEEALQANLVALKHKPVAIELLDETILECSKENFTQNRNRFFVKGDPGAILVVEFAEHEQTICNEKAGNLEAELRQHGLGYHFPLVSGSDIGKVWALRKAGLGVLSNMPGDAKPVAVIEDTALPVERLPEFYRQHTEILRKLNLRCVYYAHAATGEIHMKPILNLKDPDDVKRFRIVAEETARLVKQFGGSLSGEHGDGRLRGEFVPLVLGDKVYRMLVDVKRTWDPHNLLNPGKIVAAPSMDTSLRYAPETSLNTIRTVFDYSSHLGMLSAIENCNGSGDCRKPLSAGGTMCPSYQASLSEKDSTRGRANVLREILTRSTKENPFDSTEIAKVMEFCLACKACKSECPSNIDMARFKSEVLYNQQQKNGIPLSYYLQSQITLLRLFDPISPLLYNLLVKNNVSSALLKRLLGFAAQSTLPAMPTENIKKWMRKSQKDKPYVQRQKTIYFFCDEFTLAYDPRSGITAIKLLDMLGYSVKIPKHSASGRASISKGLLKHAKRLANENIKLLSTLIHEDCPLVGIEPSAILSFRDEYPALVSKIHKTDAERIARNAFTIEEFLVIESLKGNLTPEMFDKPTHEIFYHGHCHQKAIVGTDFQKQLLDLLPETQFTVLDCGCCGMAGSFGYEANSYALSQQIAELRLFPAIRNTPPEAIISASGISCRQQIQAGTGRKAVHPVEIFFNSLKSNYNRQPPSASASSGSLR